MTAAIERSSIDHAVAACAAGSPVVLLDGRGGGGLVAAADDIATETMAFLIRFGSGVVMVVMAGDACDRLLLPPMVWPVPDGPRGDLCVTVDAAEGVTTGISACDRARTARLLAAPATRPADLTRPGHVIPLRVRDPAGAAGIALEVAARAGRRAAVVCAVVPVRHPYTDARTDDLVDLAGAHGLPIVTAADLRHPTPAPWA